MAFDEQLADRIRIILNRSSVPFEEKKMMGGLCFMVDDKMLAGVIRNELMARIGPDLYEPALQRSGAKEMNFTGRSMKGFVFVDAEGIDMDADLEQWIQDCLAYNPIAKSSKKK